MSSTTSIVVLGNDIPIPKNQHTISQEQIDLAEKYTLWSWYDVMTALNEIGHDPSPIEKQRILQALFTKKIKHIVSGAQDEHQ